MAASGGVFCLSEFSAEQVCLWAHDGYMSHADTVRCIELFGNEVLPALRSDQVSPAVSRWRAPATAD